MISETWKKATIGELCQMIKGTAPIMKTRPGPYPLLTMGEEHKTADHFQLDGEAVCVPMISSFGHGKPGLKRVHYVQGKFALSNLLTALVVKDHDRLSTRYLALYLNIFKDQLIVPLQTGAANMSLRPEKLASVPVHYPSLEDQGRIVHLMEEVEAIRHLRANAIERTSRLIPAIFYEVFGGFEGDSKWQKLPLGKLVIEIQPGFAQRPDGAIGGIRQIRPMNITADGSLTLDGTKSIPCTLAKLKKYELKKLDVIFNNTNSRDLVGKTTIFNIDGQFVFSNHMTRIRPDKRFIDPHYLATYLHLLWSVGYFEQLCTQWINQAAINKDELSKTLIAVPPIKLQQKFLFRISEIRAFRLRQLENSEALGKLYSVMAAKAFEGVI
jgi:type I restriction enzyme S subunit